MCHALRHIKKKPTGENSNYIHGEKIFMKAMDDSCFERWYYFNKYKKKERKEKEQRRDLVLISVEYGCVGDKYRKLNLGKSNKKQIWRNKKNALSPQQLYYRRVLN